MNIYYINISTWRWIEAVALTSEERTAMTPAVAERMRNSDEGGFRRKRGYQQPRFLFFYFTS
ncbi:hypothetical protein KDK_09190 [Dictyobacter kobayashii]|uniref:Uncharacterized protein n=1 Tax=Dictyobacter kobayashii TaxID=2014872 RepID=A0A402ADD2_9CHLR|nr:hypothetical protein KDK_09190 [Dictyobacter kobayashii]